MRHSLSFVQVERKICHFQRTVKLDTAMMRNKWISELDQVFDMATAIAKGKVSQQQVGDKMQIISPKERQMWAQVAANIGMVMGNLSKACDERQIDKDLDTLERLLSEITAQHEKEVTTSQATVAGTRS